MPADGTTSVIFPFMVMNKLGHLCQSREEITPQAMDAPGRHTSPSQQPQFTVHPLVGELTHNCLVAAPGTFSACDGSHMGEHIHTSASLAEATSVVFLPNSQPADGEPTPQPRKPKVGAPHSEPLRVSPPSPLTRKASSTRQQHNFKRLCQSPLNSSAGHRPSLVNQQLVLPSPDANPPGSALPSQTKDNNRKGRGGGGLCKHPTPFQRAASYFHQSRLGRETTTPVVSNQLTRHDKWGSATCWPHAHIRRASMATFLLSN